MHQSSIPSKKHLHCWPHSFGLNTPIIIWMFWWLYGHSSKDSIFHQAGSISWGYIVLNLWVCQFWETPNTADHLSPQACKRMALQIRAWHFAKIDQSCVFIVEAWSFKWETELFGRLNHRCLFISLDCWRRMGKHMVFYVKKSCWGLITKQRFSYWRDSLSESLCHVVT